MSDKYVWVFPPQPKNLNTWEWPACFYNGAARKMAAFVVCERPYNPYMEGIGAHPPLAVTLLRYNMGERLDPLNNGRRMLCALRFVRLRLAIEFTQAFLDQNTDWNPRII